jgi:hypothetical protein
MQQDFAWLACCATEKNKQQTGGMLLQDAHLASMSALEFVVR